MHKLKYTWSLIFFALVTVITGMFFFNTNNSVKSLDTKTHKPDNITAEKTTQTTTPFTQHEETNNREETGRIEDDYQPHQDQPDMTEGNPPEK